MIETLTDPDEIAAAEARQRGRLAAAGLPEAWAATGEVFRDQYVSIVRDAVRFPSGELGTYIRVGRGSAVAGGVVAVPRLGDRYVLVRHWRHATRRYHLEFPRGCVEPGESGLQAVLRELAEEIGARIVGFAPVGRVYPDTGTLSDTVEVFAVDVAATRLPQAAADEGIAAVELHAFDGLMDLAGSGLLDDAITLAALIKERAWRAATRDVAADYGVAAG